MEYTSLNAYLKDRFGTKVYKIALDGGFTCPNRDGKIGYGGCIFCSAGGSGDFAGNREKSITQQINDGKKILENKIKNGKYIAYFQAFTSTYAPIKKLEKTYSEAINNDDIVALSIATRPDCLDDDVIALLDKMNKIKPVFVELGLQTTNEKSAIYIRRGYPLSIYDDAVKKLKSINVNIVTHVIIGLPNETKSDMINTVKYVINSGSNGIKLQLLHIIDGTDLAEEWKSGKIKTLSMEEYIDIIKDCISIIPKDIVIHRLTGDGAKKDLLAPLWSSDKKRVLNEINKALKQQKGVAH